MDGFMLPVDCSLDSLLDLLGQEVALCREVLGGVHQGLDPLLVAIHILLQVVQGLQQPADRRQVRPAVLTGDLLLHRAQPLLHVIKGALKL